MESERQDGIQYRHSITDAPRSSSGGGEMVTACIHSVALRPPRLLGPTLRIHISYAFSCLGNSILGPGVVNHGSSSREEKTQLLTLSFAIRGDFKCVCGFFAVSCPKFLRLHRGMLTRAINASTISCPEQSRAPPSHQVPSECLLGQQPCRTIGDCDMRHILQGYLKRL